MPNRTLAIVVEGGQHLARLVPAAGWALILAAAWPVYRRALNTPA